MANAYKVISAKDPNDGTEQVLVGVDDNGEPKLVQVGGDLAYLTEAEADSVKQGFEVEEVSDSEVNQTGDKPDQNDRVSASEGGAISVDLSRSK